VNAARPAAKLSLRGLIATSSQVGARVKGRQHGDARSALALEARGHLRHLRFDMKTDRYLLRNYTTILTGNTVSSR
jgi:hypothetical protein